MYSNFGGAGTPPSAHRAVASGAGNFDHRSKIMRMAGSEEPCGLTGACTARPAQAGPGLGPAGPAAGQSPYGALARPVISTPRALTAGAGYRHLDAYGEAHSTRPSRALTAGPAEA